MLWFGCFVSVRKERGGEGGGGRGGGGGGGGLPSEKVGNVHYLAQECGFWLCGTERNATIFAIKVPLKGSNKA